MVIQVSGSTLSLNTSQHLEKGALASKVLRTQVPATHCLSFAKFYLRTDQTELERHQCL